MVQPNYSRSVNIGKPGVTQDVQVKNFSEVITELETVIAKAEETIEELRKLTAGLSVVIGADLNEEVS